MSQFYILPFLAYVAVASPAAHQATRSVLGSWVASPEGCAKFGGLLLHGVVFVLLVSLLMRRKSYDKGEKMGTY